MEPLAPPMDLWHCDALASRLGDSALYSYQWPCNATSARFKVLISCSDQLAMSVVVGGNTLDGGERQTILSHFEILLCSHHH